MKKTALFVLILAALILTVSAQVAPPQAAPDDGSKNLVLVASPAAPPEAFKAGFQTISARDSLALLTFIASDLTEGRETGTRGFQIAAEYGASLFGLWGLKPVGDMPTRTFGMAQMIGLSSAPVRPARRTPSSRNSPWSRPSRHPAPMSLEIRQGGSVRTHAFRPAVDFQGLAAGRRHADRRRSSSPATA